jgi:hypothetical protein
MSKALLLDPKDGDLIMTRFWISTSTFESQKVDQSH